jgi:hypothetical protein
MLNKKIKQIQKIREKNNFLWCEILDLAFKTSPKEAKIIFNQITQNDAEINNLSKELCK